MSNPQTPSESPIKPPSPGKRPVAPPPPPPSKKLVSELEPQELSTSASNTVSAPSPSSSIVIRKSPAPALPPSKSRPATPSTSDSTPPPPVVVIPNVNAVTTPRKSPPPALPPSKSRPTTPTASSQNRLANSVMNTTDSNNNNTINNTSGSIKLEQSQSQSISGLQLSRSGVTTPRKKAPPTPPMSPRNNTNAKSNSRPATPSASGKFVPPSPRTSTAAVRQLIAEKNRDLSRSQSQESSNIHGDTSSSTAGAPGEDTMRSTVQQHEPEQQQQQQQPNETASGTVQEDSTINKTHENEKRNEQDQQQHQQQQASLIQQLPNQEKSQEQDKQLLSSVNDDDSGRLPINMKLASASVRTQAPTATSDHDDEDDDKNNRSDSMSTPILPTKQAEAQQQQQAPAVIAVASSSSSKPNSKPPSRSGSSTVQAVQQQQQYQRSTSLNNNNNSNSTSKLLIDPKILPPAPSFQHERLALLRHLKETPKLVSHATSTEIEDVNDEALNQFDEMHADNNMSSTLDEARVREAMKHDRATTNARSSSNHQQFHVSTPPPQKNTSSSSRDPYSSALSAALSTPHDQLVKKQQEEAILAQQRRIQQQQEQERKQHTITSSSSVSNSKKSSPSPPNPRTASAISSSSLEPTTTKLDLLQATNAQLQQYLFLRDLEVEELLFRSQISEHAIEFIDELRTDFWKSLFNVTQPLSKNRDLKVSDQSVQSLVLALEEAQTQSAHAADRLQETYDVLDRMSEELADSRSMTLQVQADLTHTREIHAATIEQMKLSHERERESWMDRAEEKFMKRVKKLASRVASQEQELMELRGAIASLRNMSSSMPGGSELALRIVEDALNVESYESHREDQQQQHQHIPPSNRSSQQQQRVNNNINQNISTSSRTGSQQQQQYYDASVDISNNNNDDVHTGGTRRLFQSGVLDAQSATVRRLIEKGYLSPP